MYMKCQLFDEIHGQCDIRCIPNNREEINNFWQYMFDNSVGGSPAHIIAHL